MFSYIGSVTARHSSSGVSQNFAAWYKEWNCRTFADVPPIFGWAAITLGIGLHSSSFVLCGSSEHYVKPSMQFGEFDGYFVVNIKS